MTRRRGRIMRDKPPRDTLLDRYYRHVDRVAAELANASAPPPFVLRVLRAIWRAVGPVIRREVVAFLRWFLDLPKAYTRVTYTPPPPIVRHYPSCEHPNAYHTSLGAVVKRPKLADRPLYLLHAKTCPDCGLTVAVLARPFAEAPVVRARHSQEQPL